MRTPKLTEATIRAAATPQSFQRGQGLHERGAISHPTRQALLLRGRCSGTSAPFYEVAVELDPDGLHSASCNCEYDFGGMCKHIVALLLLFLEQPKAFMEHPGAEALLAPLDRDALAAVLTQILQTNPELITEVEMLLTVPKKRSAAGKAKTKKAVDIAPYRRQVRGIFRNLNGMRMSEAYWHIGGLVEQLKAVQLTALELLAADDAETAYAILMLLAEETLDGIEHIDDSDGYLGDFAHGLGLPLTEAVLSMTLSTSERQRRKRAIEALDAQLEDYGMGGLSLAVDALDYGWDRDPALRATFALAGSAKHRVTAEDDEAEDVDEDEEEEDDSYADQGHSLFETSEARADLFEARLNVLERRGDSEAFLTQATRAGRHARAVAKLIELKRVKEALKHAKAHFSQAEDAHVCAQQLQALGHTDDALALGELGLTLDGQKAQLGVWLGPLEEKCGRKTQALAA